MISQKAAVRELFNLCSLASLVNTFQGIDLRGVEKCRVPINPPSCVDKPPSVCSVSVICASNARAGWQHVNISLSRSSGRVSSISGSSCVRESGIGVEFSSNREWRRRSMARRYAMVVSQAPGFRGTPSILQRSRALTSAFCKVSSASSKSPSWLIRAARTRPCSSRNVFSICSLVAVPFSASSYL